MTMSGEDPLKLARRAFIALVVAMIVATGAPQRAAADVVVREVQRILADEGYDPGEIDGIAGRTTKSAVAAFQRDHGLPATGRLDRRTLGLMRATYYGRDLPTPPIAQPATPSDVPPTTGVPHRDAAASATVPGPPESDLKPTVERVDGPAGLVPLGDAATTGAPPPSLAPKPTSDPAAAAPISVSASRIETAPAPASVTATTPVSATPSKPAPRTSAPPGFFRAPAAQAVALGALASLALGLGAVWARRHRHPARHRMRTITPAQSPRGQARRARTPHPSNSRAGARADPEVAYRRWLVRGTHTTPADRAFLLRYLVDLEARYFDEAAEAGREAIAAEVRALALAHADDADFSRRAARFLTAVDVERLLR